MNQALHKIGGRTEQQAKVEDSGQSAAARSGFSDWLFRVVPAVGSLRTYSLGALRADALAGLTVATVAVPQAMAYATIAGLPPQHGLYTAIVMTARRRMTFAV